MTPFNPVFSIITVVYNRKEDIAYTLESVTNQSYPHIDYIVIDGNSSDGTKSIISKNQEKIQTYVSEDDKGIYDAMNKGLSKAKGQYILFLNGGDSLYDTNTLQDIVDRMNECQIIDPDIIYGECMLVNRNRQPFMTRSEYRNQILPKSLDYFSFRLGTNVSHQAFIVKKELCKFYNLDYRWASDIDWMLNCLKKAKTNVLYNGIICNFVIGDSSEKHKVSSLLERFKIMRKHYGLFKTLVSHLLILKTRVGK